MRSKLLLGTYAVTAKNCSRFLVQEDVCNLMTQNKPSFCIASVGCINYAFTSNQSRRSIKINIRLQIRTPHELLVFIIIVEVETLLDLRKCVLDIANWVKALMRGDLLFPLEHCGFKQLKPLSNS